VQAIRAEAPLVSVLMQLGNLRIVPVACLSVPYWLWGPWGTGLRATAVKGPPTSNLAFNTFKSCQRTMIVAQLFYAIYQEPANTVVDRDPNLGCETFHSGSRNNLNFHFKLAILIRGNKCNHLGLQFYALSFIQFCARKLLLLIETQCHNMD